MATITGIQKFYVAVINSDSESAISYATPKYYQYVQEIGAKPKQNTENLYAENRLIDQATALESIDIDVTLASLTSVQKAEILGQNISSTGGVYGSQEDEAPFVAILYKASLSKGGYRYGVWYKGKFGLPEDAIKGQEGKVTFQPSKISATFQCTDYVFTDSEGKKHLYEYHVDTTDPNCPADIDTTWFASVHMPNTDSTAPSVTVVPADAATSVSVTSNIVWTFSKAINSASINAANFILMKATDGTVIDGTLSVDTTNKIVTLDPTASLSAATAYIAIATSNITDAYGNKMASNSIINFTTA